jgi:succinate-acetate transporter protein
MMMDRERTEQDDFSVGAALAWWRIYTDKMVFLGLQLSPNLVVLIREQIIRSLSLSGVNEN